jgi:hypothetical protein
MLTAPMLPSNIAGPDRHFLPSPARTEGPAQATLRIWDVDANALFVVLGVLVTRGELEGLFRDFVSEERGGYREDVLLLEAASRCTKVGRFSLAVEKLLDERTRGVRQRFDACPLAELAGLWLRARESAGGRELAGILWALARDRRWLIHGLFDHVRGDLWVRALRLLGDRDTRRSTSVDL